MKRKTFKFLVTKAKPFLKKGGSYVAAAVTGDVLGDIALEKGKAWLDKRRTARETARRFKHINASPRYKKGAERIQRKMNEGIKKIYSEGIKKHKRR